MFSYRTYGLNIISELEMPELIPGIGDADLTIRFGKVERLPEDMDKSFHSFWATPEETCLCFQGTGAFLIRHGREIVIDPLGNVDARVLRLGILGPSLSMVLHQRGYLVLHGSAVAIGGKAISFLGNSGDGKSTMAAVLHTRGHALIADDLSVVDFDSVGQPILLPGFPQLKLWPEAVSVLGDEPDDLHRLHPLMDKRARRTHNAFTGDTLPLHSIFVLDEGDSSTIEPIQSGHAFIELVRHSHNALLLEATGSSVQHFGRCTQLVNRAPLYSLRRPRDLSQLPDVAKLIEDHLV
jgi:hypothetical protein